MPTWYDHEQKLLAAVQDAMDEHGVPSRFAPGELAQKYGAPPPMTQGHIGRYWKPWKMLEHRGQMIMLLYEDRHWRVAVSQLKKINRR